MVNRLFFSYRGSTSSRCLSHAVSQPPPPPNTVHSFCSRGHEWTEAGWRWRRSGVALVGIQYHTARTSAVRLLYEWTAAAIGWARVMTASQSRCLDPFVAAAAVSPGYHLLKLHRRACGWISGSGWHVFAQPRLSHNPKTVGSVSESWGFKKKKKKWWLLFFKLSPTLCESGDALCSRRLSCNERSARCKKRT